MWDKAQVTVKSGKGGNGSVSFRHEAHVPLGGPDGGDGGRGGSVYLVADPNERSLQEFVSRRLLKAEAGGNGSQKNMSGKNGEDLFVRVPVGTLVSRQTGSGEKELLADLDTPGSTLLVARGGVGGAGNSRFATSINRAPRIAQNGEPSESLEISLELRLLADVGITGLPNVGKSSLLAAISGARPKIGDYPFTTIEPVLGIVSLGDDTYAFADIPGLIEGAHAGRGLGVSFLQHIRRCKVLVHLVAATSDDPLGDYRTIRKEMEVYDAELAAKPEVVAVNKIDLLDSKTLTRLKKTLKPILPGPIFYVSTVSRKGIDELLEHLHSLLTAQPAPEPVQASLPVMRPEPRQPAVVAVAPGDFAISSRRLERTLDLRTMDTPEALAYIKRQLDRHGLTKALLKAGIKPGNRVRVGRVEIKWQWE